MARFQSSTAVFTKKIGVEVNVPNLQFATFFGDGTLNSRDSINLVPGGSTFANIGSGPVLAPSYGTFTTETNSLDTGMLDAYPSATTMIVVAAKPAGSGSPPGTLVQFSTSAAAGAAAYLASHVSTIQGNIVGSGDNLNLPTLPPAFPIWGLYAWVITPGAVSVLYDLTQGDQIIGTVVNPNVATHTGTWQIGGYMHATGGTNPLRIAFALGAATGLNLTQLNAFATSLRFPLAARGIIV